jgi:hypothetical protein
MIRIVAILALTLTACSPQTSPTRQQSSSTATLYRNSPIDHTLRVHFGTFDAAENDGVNLDNCGMTARLLNANVDAWAKTEGKTRDPTVGFWCEPGNFSKTGNVPMMFESQFPTDVRDGPHW